MASHYTLFPRSRSLRKALPIIRNFVDPIVDNFCLPVRSGDLP